MKKPMYVSGKNIEKNQVILSEKEGIYFEGLLANDFNWISLPPKGEMAVEAKTRYNGKAVPAIVSLRENGDVFLRFPEKERAVTKGQAVVLYDGDLVLGGGTILEGYKKL